MTSRWYYLGFRCEVVQRGIDSGFDWWVSVVGGGEYGVIADGVAWSLIEAESAAEQWCEEHQEDDAQ